MAFDSSAAMFGYNEDGTPKTSKTEQGFEYYNFDQYIDLTFDDGKTQYTDSQGSPAQVKSQRDRAEINKGGAAINKSRLKGMQGKKTPLLATGDQSKVRNVLSTGPMGDASQGLGSNAAKTLLGL